MTALAQDKARRQEAWRYKQFTLLSGTKAYKGARAVFNVGSNTVQPALAAPTNAAGQLPIGVFAEQVDATGGALPVTIDFEVELTGERFANDGTNPCSAATDFFAMSFHSDDQTVSISPGAARTPAGRILDVDATLGVLVQKLDQPNFPLETPFTATTPATYTANALALTQVSNGAVYDVPTTAGVSTITLPAGAPDGTSVTFCADGTKNGHTVQYMDGATPLTAAFVASKRHMVCFVKRGGKWFATGSASP
jgi:hypothetical protein